MSGSNETRSDDPAHLRPRLAVGPRGPLVGRRCRSSSRVPCRGRTSVPSTGDSAASSTSARGTYQRGAKPDSNSTSGRRAVRDDPVAVAHHQVPGGRADVVAVVRVGGVPDDALVLLVERVHRPPRERDPVVAARPRAPGRSTCSQAARGASRAPPCTVNHVVAPRSRWAVTRSVALECARGHVAAREVGDRVAAGLVQEHDVLAVGDPLAAEPYPHPPPRRLREQQALGQGIGNQEPADAP